MFLVPGLPSDEKTNSSKLFGQLFCHDLIASLLLSDRPFAIWASEKAQ